MGKIWLQHYDPGIPFEINPDAYSSLVELFTESCSRYHNRPAFYHLGRILSYDELTEYSTTFSIYLQQCLRLQQGDRIAIMLPNTLHYPIAIFSILKIGAIIVTLNPLYTQDEVAHQLIDSGAKAIIVLEQVADTLQNALKQKTAIEHVIIARISDFFSLGKRWISNLFLKYIRKNVPHYHYACPSIYFRDALIAAHSSTLQSVPIKNTDIALLQYTGGTTGVPKGAMLTHRNLIANIQQITAWFNHSIVLGHESILTALPMYHVFSLMANCLFFMSIGGLNVLITDPRHLNDIIKHLKRFPCTSITGVNTLFRALLHHPAFKQLNFSNLKRTFGGGMATQKIIAEEWKAVTGCVLLEAYGLTETSPCLTINRATLTCYNGTVGLPVPSTDIRIIDPNTEKELPIASIGELLVSGPQVMQGYWHQSEETKNVLTKEGWLHTGDMAMLNEHGELTIIDRKKDLIIISGFNVYPNEVEKILLAFPGIKDAAVIGIHDEHGDELVKALIVKEDQSITKEAILAHCHQHLAAYKVPKIILFSENLPRSPLGKILKKSLKSMSPPSQ